MPSNRRTTARPKARENPLVWPGLRFRCPECRVVADHRGGSNLSRRGERTAYCGACDSEIAYRPIGRRCVAENGVPFIEHLGFTARLVRHNLVHVDSPPTSPAGT